jgi:N-acetylneuraminic acid mutarotase
MGWKTWTRRVIVPAGLGCVLTAGMAAPAVAGHHASAWASLAPVPAATEGMSVAHVGNVIVAAYGFSPASTSGDTNLTRLYNIATNTWSRGAAAPGGPSSEGTAVAHGGSIYALGGRNGTQNHMNHRYTPATNTWAVLAPMPTGRTGLAAAVVGDTIFAIGGRQDIGGPCSGPPLATVERYNIAHNTWTTGAPLPARRSDIGAIAHGGKIYVFGGCTNGLSSVSRAVDIYDPVTNTWAKGAPMPTARAGFYGVGIVGGNIYVMGGINAAGQPSAANEVYNIAHNTWTKTTPMRHPRGEMGVTSHGGRIFTVGGSLPAFGASVRTNDSFRP